jgi:signal transduction histidine kinase
LPWRDKDGNIIGTFGISKDFSALKKAEVELEAAHERLVETSRLAGMAEVATDVLHNVGNVLNSVNVSCSLAVDRVKASKAASLFKVSALLEENRGRLGEFLLNDPRGQQIPGFLAALAEHFTGEQSALLQELDQLRENIAHIKQIVAMQQSYAKVAGVTESVSAAQLVEDALHINGSAMARHTVKVRREFEESPPIVTDKHRVLQILVNLISNAKYALDDSGRPDRLMTLRIGGDGDGHAKIQVSDNGVGIPPENLTRIFAHGFTTRRNGHGFGLHSSALAVRELGGSIQAQSEGLGKGATFTLLLPHNPPAQPI